MLKVQDAKLSMTLQAHIAEKSMYAGGHSLSYYSGPIWNSEKKILEWITEKDKVEYVPSIYKIIDEIIVNTFDHVIACANNRILIPSKSKKKAPRMITRIECEFDPETGVITVYNNGNGIPVEKNEGTYCPEKFFTKDKTGTNLERDPYRTTGGINGLGACITVALSEWLEIETQDEFHKYTQRFETIKKIYEPKITKATGATEYTRITFKPQYVRLEKEFGYGAYTKEVSATIDRWLRTRMLCLSLAVNAITPVKVKYNRNLIGITSANHVPILFQSDKSTTIKLKLDPKTDIGYNKLELLNLKVIFVADPAKKGRSFSIINGVLVKQNAYLNKLIDSVVDYAKKQISGDIKITDSLVSNCFSAVMVGCMMDPQSDSQTKERIPIRKNFGMENYIYNETRMSRSVYDLIKDIFIDMILDRNAKVRINKRQLDRTKYVPAKFAGGKNRRKTVLFLPEGDSAMGTIRKGISTDPANWDTCGMLSLGGVIMNIKKNCTIHRRDGKTIYVFNEKFKHNRFIQDFLHVTNLDFNKTYETEKEFNTLHYGAICIAVDEDLDGKGHIASLVNLIVMTWPALYTKWQWVKRLPTPIVRAFHKTSKIIIEFDRIEDLNDWIAENPDEVHKYVFDYYKGLASIEDNNIKRIFQRYQDNFITFLWDSEAEKYAEIYYGKLTSERKVELSTPREPLTAHQRQDFDRGRCKLTTQFRYEAKEFQKDNVKRKIPGVLDGQNDVGRKVISAMIDRFAKGSVKLKCSVISAITINEKMYLHGDMPIQDAIVHLGQQFLGKNIIPFLASDEGIGTRVAGGKDHGAARYIRFRLNKKFTDIVMPKEDRWIVPYVYEEGKMCEPQMFVPILPTILWKYYEVPATGWKCSLWARDVDDTIRIVKAMIRAIMPPVKVEYDHLQIPKFTHRGLDKKYRPPREVKPSVYKFKGSIRKFNGYDYYVGSYEIDGDNITITELPITLWNNTFINKIIGDTPEQAREKEQKNQKIYLGKQLIDPDSVADRSGKDNVHIEMRFISGWREKLPKSKRKFLDDIEAYLGLKKKMDNLLNVILPDGSVRTYDRYMDIVKFWFKERVDLYIKRFRREFALLKYKVLIEENTIRYIENFKELKLMGMEETQANALLKKHKYDEINAGFVIRAQIIDLDSLHDNVMKHPKDTNYDYLTNISAKRAFKSELEKHKNTLEEYKKRLKELESLDIIRKTWLGEIKQFEDILAEGFRTDWLFDHFIDPEKSKCVKGRGRGRAKGRTGNATEK